MPSTHIEQLAAELWPDLRRAYGPDPNRPAALEQTRKWLGQSTVFREYREIVAGTQWDITRLLASHARSSALMRLAALVEQAHNAYETLRLARSGLFRASGDARRAMDAAEETGSGPAKRAADDRMVALAAQLRLSEPELEQAQQERELIERRFFWALDSYIGAYRELQDAAGDVWLGQDDLWDLRRYPDGHYNAAVASARQVKALWETPLTDSQFRRLLAPPAVRDLSEDMQRNASAVAEMRAAAELGRPLPEPEPSRRRPSNDMVGS